MWRECGERARNTGMQALTRLLSLSGGAPVCLCVCVFTRLRAFTCVRGMNVPCVFACGRLKCLWNPTPEVLRYVCSLEIPSEWEGRSAGF